MLDSRTLLQLDELRVAHVLTRDYWSGSSIETFRSYGTVPLASKNRSLVSFSSNGDVKVWGPGFANYNLHAL